MHPSLFVSALPPQDSHSADGVERGVATGHHPAGGIACGSREGSNPGIAAGRMLA